MDIALFTLRAISQAIITPPYVFILIMLSFVLYTKNKKTAIMQKMIIGEKINTPFELTISQVVLGILAGVIGSLILSHLGVMFKDDTILFLLFVISILLMFFGGRYICFSYSAGILSVVSVLIRFVEQVDSVKLTNFDFLKVDVVMIMSLVGVLHIVEGILVMIDGNSGAIPVFTNRENKIIGGFAFKRYWALPIALLFIVSASSIAAGSEGTTPSWWPIIRSPYSQILKSSVLAFGAFYGMLGYNSVTFTRTKREKVVVSGISISIYGSVLLLVAQLAQINLLAQLFVGIFAPVAHEAMLRLQTYMEFRGNPKYISSDDGLMVLEVAPSSPAFEMGIKSGDILVEVNNKKIINEQDIIDALSEVSNFLWLKIKNVQGKLEELDYNKMNSTKRLGIVFVPRGIPNDKVVVKLQSDSFREALEKAKKRDDDE